jgi:excisionase family DNA binding protein
MNSPLLPEDDQPLRIKTVAEWLGVSEKTVRRLIDHGKIVSVKIGGLRMILRRDFKAYLQQLKGIGGGQHV